MTDREKKEIYMMGYEAGLNVEHQFYSREYQEWEPSLLEWLNDDTKSFESVPEFEMFDDFDEEDNFGDDELDDYVEMSDADCVELEKLFNRVGENKVPVDPN